MKIEKEYGDITLRVTLTADEAKRLHDIHGDTSDNQWKEITKEIRGSEDAPYTDEDGRLMAKFSELLYHALQAR